MKIKQFKLYYNSNSSEIYEKLFKGLQNELANKCFYSWNISRNWQYGPHFMLSLSMDDFFYCDEIESLIEQHMDDFLIAYPSDDYIDSDYKKRQKKLMKLENINMDSQHLEPNNSYRSDVVDFTVLAKAYENEQQWLSVFEANNRLRPLIITQHSNENNDSNERMVFNLMMLLAVVYPPKPSVDEIYDEYNGFLSYHSNYVFWHHSLTDKNATTVTEKFELDFAHRQPQFNQWLTQLQRDIRTNNNKVIKLSDWVLQHFTGFSQMAHQDVIHWRSPYPKTLLADKNQVSDFHKKFFFNQDGSASTFPTDFSGYRWLLNIVYKALPLFNFSPLQRQFFNYSLARIQKDKSQEICDLRQDLYYLC